MTTTTTTVPSDRAARVRMRCARCGAWAACNASDPVTMTDHFVVTVRTVILPNGRRSTGVRHTHARCA